MFQDILYRIKKLREQRAIILMYHQVCQRKCDPWELAVHPNHFYDQLDYLKKNFNVVPVGELAAQKPGWKRQRTVAITFDDGFRDNYTNAAPLLEWHELPATFYVATTAVQEGHQYWWDALQDMILHSEILPATLDMLIAGEPFRFVFRSDRVLDGRLMKQIRSWNCLMPVPNERVALYMALWQRIRPLGYAQQGQVMRKISEWARWRNERPGEAVTMTVREMQNLGGSPLFTIGAHSVSHAMLSSQCVDDQTFEIRESKRQIEAWLGRKVDGFAYPYGNFNQVTQSILKESGFGYAVSTEARPVTSADDRFALPRLQVKNWCVYEFASKLNEMIHE